jgi:hypothetical protein
LSTSNIPSQKSALDVAPSKDCRAVAKTAQMELGAWWRKQSAESKSGVQSES